MPNKSQNKIFLEKKINIVSPDETANKLSSGSFIKKYKQKSANEKIPSTTCPFLIVEEFRKEAKKKGGVILH